MLRSIVKKIYKHTEVDENHTRVFEIFSKKFITGIVEEYNKKGKLVRKSEYQNGIRHGIHEGYNNGIMYHNSVWRNGKPNGDWKNYSSCLCKEHIFFKNGKLKFKKYFARDGSLIREEKYISGLPNGYFEEYSGIKNSFVWAGNYKKGNKIGLWKLYKKTPLSNPIYFSLFKGKKNLQMGYKNIRFGKSKSIVVGNSKNGKPYGWWFWFSVQKLSNELKFDLEQLWNSWEFKPEDELPKNLNKLLNKKQYYK